MGKLKEIRNIQDLTKSIKKLVEGTLRTSTVSYVQQEVGFLLEELEQETQKLHKRVSKRRGNGKETT